MDTPVEIYIDGASRGNPGDSGIGIFFKNNEQYNFKKYIGIGTNNNAEYTALITALEISILLKSSIKSNFLKLVVHTDSMLVANQINGNWKVKDPEIKILFTRAKELIEELEQFSISHIRRELNSEADLLANEAINEYFNN